jgi:hypothetical protein
MHPRLAGPVYNIVMGDSITYGGFDPDRLGPQRMHVAFGETCEPR